MTQPTRRAKTQDFKLDSGALQLELKLLLPDFFALDGSGYATVREHPRDGTVQVERIGPGGSIVDHLYQLRPDKGFARRDGFSDAAPNPVDETHPLAHRVGPHCELNLLPVGHGHGSNDFPMARKGVRKKKGERLSVSGGVYANYVIPRCAYSPAVGDVQKAICVNSGSHVDEAFRSRRISLRLTVFLGQVLCRSHSWNHRRMLKRRNSLFHNVLGR